jgi:hypothetical protein
LCSAGIATFIKQRIFLQRSLKAEGIVTDLLVHQPGNRWVRERKESSEGIRETWHPRYQYRPEVRFTSRSGEEITFLGNLFLHPAGYVIGEKVPVLYAPGSPKDAIIDSFQHRWFYPLFLFGTGIFVLLMGILGVLM